VVDQRTLPVWSSAFTAASRRGRLFKDLPQEERPRKRGTPNTPARTSVGRAAPSRFAARMLASVTAAALAVAGFPVQAEAQGRGPPVIRDAEIEQLLRDYTQPVLQLRA